MKSEEKENGLKPTPPAAEAIVAKVESIQQGMMQELLTGKTELV